MTHTVQDAEAAVARHPDDLATLSMAADLLMELDDPRGEDFAACLDGRMTAEEVMRRHPACRYAMYVAAWHMLVMPNRGDAARAEGLRLLAECGKAGSVEHGYWSGVPAKRKHIECVPESWWDAAVRPLYRDRQAFSDPITNRLALLDAYAAADPGTRRQWAEETRALTPTVEVAR